MRTKFTLGLLVLLLVVASCAMAQEVTGTISGTVKDASGAVVPGATISITNTDKNAVIRTVKSDDTGNYTAPLLPIGHYSIRVEASGFKTVVRNDITLYVGNKLAHNFDLQVGTTGETVNVEASAAQVQTQSAAAAGVITGTQVRELSLNGRNWTQLVLLTPGVSDAGNADQLYVGSQAPSGTALITFSMNGGRREENNFMIDGADNMDRGSNLTLLSFPSVDSISEFTVIRGQYDPEYGRAASGQVNVVTKSGTSRLHGNVYEFFRNDALNANEPFRKLTQFNNHQSNRAPLLRYNNFGGTIGGPVYIPKVYEQTNKTFFFFSEEARRNIKYTTATATVPSTAMLTGTFAHPVCVSFLANGNCAAGGSSTTVAAINPIAQAYITDIFSKFPAPDNGTALTSTSTLAGIYNFREEIYKLDHIFSQKFSVSGKILRDNIPTREPGGLFTGLAVDNVGNTDTNSPGHSYTFRATIVPTSSFLIDAGYAYSYGSILSTPNNLLNALVSTHVAAAVASTVPFTNTLGRIPSISWGTTGGTGALTFGPYDNFSQNFSYFTNVSKVIGRHSLKFGATYYHYRKNENAGNGNQGQYTFTNGGISGLPAGSGTTNFEQAWANFLQGRVGSYSQTKLDLVADIRANTFEYYAQDSWRLRPNLTISYGVRHSMFRQPTDANGYLMNFDPKYYDIAKAPCITSSGATDVTKVGNTLTSACNPNYDPFNGYIFAKPPAGVTGHQSPFGDKVAADNNMAIAPRLGIAWDPRGDGKTSVRAGFGMFYDSGLIYGNAENDIFNGIGYQNAISFSSVSFANPTGGVVIPQNSVSGAATRLQSRIDPNYKPPYTQQWSLDIQHDIGRGWIADVGYYGNNAIHLPGFIDLNQPTANSYRSCTVANPCYGGPVVVAGNGVNFETTHNDPNGVSRAGVFVDATNSIKLNALRPYIGYLGADAVRNIYTANYHALQSQLQKKFSGNTLVNIAYTWSHGLTTNQADRSTGAVMPVLGHIRDNNYGPTVGDRRHVVVANFVWDLPWYKDQKGVLGKIIGGWELSGIQNFQTGLPGTVVTTALDPTGAGCLGSGQSPCSLRANQVGDPSAGAPETINNKWFNAAAFTDAGLVLVNGVWVAQDLTSGRPGQVRLPGYWRTDLALFKNMKFTESLNGQFRFETFNTFNHSNPVCCTSLTLGNANFNKVQSFRDPRYLEIGMKLFF